MSYLVTTEGKGGITLFLVDRTKNKKQWWTTNLGIAIQFIKYSAAQSSLKKLRYKNPQIINYDEAIVIENQNDNININNCIHPFSSEGLGQW